MNAAAMTMRPPVDWPDWMNPVLVKELRQSLRSRSFEIAYLGLIGGLTLITVFDLSSGTNSASVWFLVVLCLVFHVLLPLRLAMSFGEDCLRGNQDLIAVTGVSSTDQINQRLSALGFHTFMSGSVVLPFLMLRYFLGGSDLIDEVQYLFLLAAGTLVIGSYTLWMATLSRRERWFALLVLLFIAPFIEGLTASAAFADSQGALMSLVVWLFGAFICGLVTQALAIENLSRSLSQRLYP